jgi:hypothetical protein
MTLLALSGCGEAPVAAAKAVESRASGRAAETVAAPTLSVPTINLQRDLGLLRPGESATCRVEISNTSAKDWRVRRMRRTCRCLVAEAPPPVIRAGTSESFSVSYTAPARVMDDRRQITVEMRGAGTPVIRVDIRARVRNILTVLPENLLLHGLPGRGASGSFEAQNFDDSDWQDIAVTASPAWLTAQVVPLATAADAAKGGPRQAWRIAVAAAALPSGQTTAQGEIRVSAKGSSQELETLVPVTLHAPSAVACIPGELFFGTVAIGNASETQVTLRFSRAVEPPHPDQVVVADDLGEQLTTEWVATEGPAWDLRAVFRPATVGVLRGEVAITFKGRDDLRELRLPVRAAVE